MTLTCDNDFRLGLIEAIPRMRGYARALCRRQHLADDLVQETLLKAWEHRNNLNDSSAMKSWLFAILRNAYFASKHRARREIEDVDGAYALQVGVPATQAYDLEVAVVMTALDSLDAPQREALLLVCVEGLSYADAAEICRCKVGTIKSRVNRGRHELQSVLDRADKQAVQPLSKAA